MTTPPPNRRTQTQTCRARLQRRVWSPKYKLLVLAYKALTACSYRQSDRIHSLPHGRTHRWNTMYAHLLPPTDQIIAYTIDPTRNTSMDDITIVDRGTCTKGHVTVFRADTFALQLETMAQKILDAMDQKVDKAPLVQAAQAMGICLEHARLMRGLATTIHQVQADGRLDAFEARYRRLIRDPGDTTPALGEALGEPLGAILGECHQESHHQESHRTNKDHPTLEEEEGPPPRPS